MSFSFPASPDIGQISPQNGRLYVWTGVWELVPVVASHAAAHASDGSDPITPASIGAAASTHAHSATSITSGTLPDARLSANVVLTSDSRLSDARTPTSHTHGNLTDAGAIGSSSGQVVVTTASGVLTTAATISAASQVSGLAAVATSGSAADLTGLTKTIASFTPRDNCPPATNFATLDTRNSVLVLEYDAATEESGTFVGVINEAMSLTSGLTVRIWWMADTATSGNVRWGAQLERTGTDLDSDAYDTNAQVTSAANATSGIESVASITLTTIDSLAAGDRFRLRVYRVAADATNDTMTGDAQLVAVEVRSA
jgi:hypothetical protein